MPSTRCAARYDGFFRDERSYNYWARMRQPLRGRMGRIPHLAPDLSVRVQNKRLQDIRSGRPLLPTGTGPRTTKDWNAVEVDTETIPGHLSLLARRGGGDRPGLRGQIATENLAKLQGIIGEKFDSGSQLLRKAGIAYAPNLVDIRSDLRGPLGGFRSPRGVAICVMAMPPESSGGSCTIDLFRAGVQLRTRTILPFDRATNHPLVTTGKDQENRLVPCPI